MAGTTAFNYTPASLANGVFTPVYWKDFVIDTSDGNYWLDDYFIVVTGMVPAHTDATLSLLLSGVTVAASIVNNLGGASPVPIGVSKLVNVLASGKQYEATNSGGGGPFTFNFPVGGFWADGYTLQVSMSPSAPLPISQHYLSFTGLGDAAFAGGAPPNAPSNLTGTDGDLTWDDNAGDELGNKIEISIYDGVNSTVWFPIVSTPENATTILITEAQIRGIIAQGIADLVIADQPSYDIYFIVSSFKVGGISAPSNEYFFTYTYTAGPTPDIDITGSGGIAFGGTAAIVFIINPSGIYTLVKDKHHDTLYERAGSITTIDVTIPEPYGITGYIGDE